MIFYISNFSSPFVKSVRFRSMEESESMAASLTFVRNAIASFLGALDARKMFLAAYLCDESLQFSGRWYSMKYDNIKFSKIE